MNPSRQTRPARSGIAMTLALAGLVSQVGCRLAGRQDDAAPTQADRLMNAYPELTGGRFAVIADFENQAHMELVELIRTSDKASCDLSSKHARAATGRTGLRFVTASADDTIVISNRNANRWYLKRDWHEFDLFMLAIESPVANLSLELSIISGTGDSSQSATSSI